MTQVTLSILVGEMPLKNELRAALGAAVDGPNVVFCWGDVVYANSDSYLRVAEIDRQCVIVHEAVHSRQQKGDPQAWWRRYMADRGFRYQQELEAYRAQWAYILRHMDTLRRSRWLRIMAEDLSSPLYGDVTTLAKAQSAITRTL